MQVLDYFHYRPNLAGQGLINNNSTNAPTPIWELVYSAKSAYNITSLDAASWLSVAQSMLTNDEVFQFYFDNFSGGLGSGVYTQSERVEFACLIIGGGVPDRVADCINQNSSA